MCVWFLFVNMYVQSRRGGLISSRNELAAGYFIDANELIF